MPAEPSAEWRNAVPPLRGDLVTVRELVSQDAPGLFEGLTDPLVTAYISQPPPSIPAFDGFISWAQRERALGNGVAFGIVPHGLEHAVGLIQVRALEPTFFTAEWGFALSVPFWSTGVFQDAAALVVQFAFETLHVHRLEARAALQNGRGQAAMQKVGANPEALLGRSFQRGRHYDDQMLWSVVATEWHEASTTTPSRVTSDEARARIRGAVTETQQSLRRDRSTDSGTPPPTLYPFFLTDSRTTPVCPTCGAQMVSGECPNC